MKRGLIKDKSAQQVFGMSFGVIFSIILIVFILVVAGIAINHFLNLKKCTQIGLFIEDIQKNVDDAWNSQKFTDEVSYTLPSNLDYVCFANLSDTVRGGDLESSVYSDISIYESSNGNIFFYPREKACNMPYINIKHINIEKITESKNPYCIPIKNSKITIQVEKEFNEGLVNLK